MLEAAFATGGTLPHTRTTLEFPSALFKASDLRDTLLIPGGRFLLTFEDKWVCIWDLHSLAEDGVVSPALLNRHHLDAAIDYVVAIDMFNEVKIRLLLKVNASDTVLQEVQIHKTIDSYQVLEATYLDDGAFAIQTMGQISINCFPTVDFNVILDDNVLFRFDDLTMVWDFRANQVSGWRVRGIPPIRDIFPNQNYVFYISGEGVHGVKPFPFQPVHDNCVSLSSFSGTWSTSSFSVFHEFPHKLCSTDSVIGPVFCNSELETGRSLIYELREETTCTLKFYRYRFQFNPADPLASSLTLLQSSSQSVQEIKLSPHKLAPRSHQACEGRLVTVWSEDTRYVEDDDQLTGSIFLSLSSPSLSIIEHFNVRDIYHLQQTCKRLYLLIEEEAKSVWTRCLQRQCAMHRLFWPSYKNLSTAMELKNACTGMVRFLREMDHASAPGTTLLPRTTSLKFPPGVMSPRRMCDIYLMPGGRFLLTFEFSWIFVWDLQSVGDGKSPPLLLRHPIGDEIDWVSTLKVISSTKVRLLMRIKVVSGSNVTSPIENLKPGEDLRSWKVFELTYNDNDAFSIETVGRLAVICPEDLPGDPCAILDSNRVLLHVHESTLVWDFRNKRISAWTLEELPPVCDLFPNQGHVFYITAEGVHGAKPPPFQPLQDGQVLSIPLQESTTATFCASHEQVHSVSILHGVVWGNLWGTGLEAAQSLTYEVKEEANDTIKFYRYKFQFNHADPFKSSLKLVHSSSQLVENLDMAGCNDLLLRTDQSCEDRRVALWTEGPESAFCGAVLLSPREAFDDEGAEYYSSPSSTKPRVSDLKIIPVPVLIPALPSAQQPNRRQRRRSNEMLKLPLELQLLVIEDLGALDIFHVQLNRAFSAGHSLSPSTTTLLFPKELLSLLDVRDIYLVPGGRFVGTIEISSLAIWDLHSVKDDSRPRLLLRHRFEEEIDWASAIKMIGADKIRVLLSQNTSAEANALHNIQLGQELRSWIMLEITCPDNGEFSIQVLGRLSVVCLEHHEPVPHPVIDLDRVVFSVPRFTLVWDIHHKEVSWWTLPRGLPRIYTVVPNQGHVCYVTDGGIHGVEVPPSRPLEDNQVLRLLPPPFSEIRIPCSFSIPHQLIHHRFNVIPLDLYNTGTESRRSFFYEVAVNEDDGKTLRLYRYQFKLNTVNPVKSALSLIEMSSWPLGDIARPNHRLVPWSCRLCNGRMAIVWAEDKEIDDDDDDSDDGIDLSTSMFVSVSSPVSISDSPIPPITPGTIGKIGLVPLGLDTDSSPTPVFDFTPEFCPTSGRVVVHWMSDTNGHAVTLHEIL
ncbi:hypothetical protein EST38_g11961 [Candolleomyces aberdarensis]|uniref:F-box domain-containing protein n=1 Tax=Candolleomyces aberdarensis TaxID=2316362 RepID=A0A4Q2D5W3_9AGAR|nr:hypothetical protein EST38_g11961 [Candolleomyces aberdarensis]